MAIDLAKYVTQMEDAATDATVATAGSEAMAESLTEAAAGYLGSDLTFSGGAGTVTITAAATVGRAVVEVGGAYGLADTGRSVAAARLYPTATQALRTPWGPRSSVRGSTWGGFGITVNHGHAALEAGADAAIDAISWGNRSAS